MERRKQQEDERRQEEELRRQLETEKRQLQEEQRRIQEKKVRHSCTLQLKKKKNPLIHFLRRLKGSRGETIGSGERGHCWRSAERNGR